MKTLCSGTRFDTEITTDQCLECALSDDADCGFDYVTLKAIFSDKERTGIHVTDLTGCLRKSYFEKTKPKPKRVHEKLLLFLGTLTHGIFEQALEEDAFAEGELPVEGLGIVGTSDVVYNNGRIVDFKTTRWMRPSMLPYGSHEIQVNIYAQVLREMGREINELYIQYIDMSGPSKCRACKVACVMHDDGGITCPLCGYEPRDGHLGVTMVEIPIWTEKQVTDYINRRRDQLELALAFDDQPGGEPSFLCRYCSYTDECDVADIKL